jgi:hypothetical protein
MASIIVIFTFLYITFFTGLGVGTVSIIYGSKKVQAEATALFLRRVFA